MRFLPCPCEFLVAVMLSLIALLGAEPSVGKWVLNTSKSKWYPGPVPKSQVITIWREGDWTLLKVEGTDASGKRVASSLSRYKEDGAPHPIDDGTATATVKKVSDHEYYVTEKS